jgi:hypothetical protein
MSSKAVPTILSGPLFSEQADTHFSNSLFTPVFRCLLDCPLPLTLVRLPLAAGLLIPTSADYHLNGEAYPYGELDLSVWFQRR